MMEIDIPRHSAGGAARRGAGNRSQAPDGKIRLGFIVMEKLVDRLDAWRHAHCFPTRTDAIVEILTKELDAWDRRIAEEEAKPVKKGKR